MKSIKTFLAVLLTSCLCFVSCNNDDIISRLGKLEQELSELSSNKVSSVEKQIASINESISLLTEMDVMLKALIESVEPEQIEELQAKDAAIEAKIEELKVYVEKITTEMSDWASTTFSTIAQYTSLCDEVATIKLSVETMNTELLEVISALETSMKGWINEQLAGYMTIAEAQAELEALGEQIEKNKDDNSEALKELEAMKEDIASSKQELTEAYTKAISDAIKSYNGVIESKIAAEIATVNQKIKDEIAALSDRIEEIEKRLSDIEGRLDALECIKHIQTLVFLPEYDDGKAYINIDGETVKLDVTLQIRPSEYAEKLVSAFNAGMSNFLFADLLAVEQTKAAQIPITLPLSSLSLLSNGIVEAFFDASVIDIDNLIKGFQSYMCCIYAQFEDAIVSSPYIDLGFKGIIPTDEIWYTTSDGETITFPSGSYTTFGANVISNKNINGQGVIKFDSKVTSIGGNAFSGCSNLTSIEIPNSVTSIGSSAFSGCSNLTSIEIPNSVTSIGYGAFYNCSNLTSIEIPNSVISIGDSAFYNCSNLTSIEIPNSVTSIGIWAFSGCTSLTSFFGKYASEDNRCLVVEGELIYFAPAGLTEYTIPNSVTSIGDFAFQSCHNLTSIEIPNSVTSIGFMAFHSCHNLTSIEIPNSVTSIGDEAFHSCHNLTSIEIPNSVTSIGDFAFSDCSKLILIEIPNSVTSIRYGAFYNCSNLTSIEFPNSVTSIGNMAFAECSNLTSIKIPNSVTSIGNSAFADCSNLTSIEIPNSVISIGDGAFYRCTGKAIINCNLPDNSNTGKFSYANFSEVIIGESVTKIENYAFYHCTCLTSVTIGNSVTSIGNSAFEDCSNLISVYCKPMTPPTSYSYAFYGCSSSLNIYVPTTSVDAYKTASYWSGYASKIVGYDFE